ncbi:hypothetical protein [Stenotrophomonas oahuensis]|uniref:ParB/Sulfiredoxin domain-containing protein n=1 Tax=Stenotrophomonas oahuensis TaxID=3003271 RepID=A0ABY9YRI7_9GAMM|nr:hypothetical protein [Stenotrophomonas sp. A5586]WNH52823.1 hypothetical protein PDM29_00700 [Stenotrophomonas sp. A5586]
MNNIVSQVDRIEDVPLEHLIFDPLNPRFAGLDYDGDFNLVDRMTEDENVQELMGSIGAQGYFAGEPLLVARTNMDAPVSQENPLIVVEGNRRLAALKLLAGLISSNKASVAALRESAIVKPVSVACILFNERKEILRYLGYRHITGAKRWEPLPKARYLKQLRDEFFGDLTADEQHRRLAKEIGSRADYVAQMLTGLNVYERSANQRFFDLAGVTAESVEFSLLTTALSYSAIAEYIGLRSRTDVEGSDLQDSKCRDLFFWMYSPKEDGFTILGESRKLKYLAAVVTNSVAIEDLRATKDLDRAFLMSEGPAKALMAVLNAAHRQMKNAYDLIPQVSELDHSHEAMVEKLYSLSEDLSTIIRRRARRKESFE